MSPLPERSRHSQSLYAIVLTAFFHTFIANIEVLWLTSCEATLKSHRDLDLIFRLPTRIAAALFHVTNTPPADRFRRTSLAFAPSDPDVIYALASDRSDDNVLGVFRSTNGGNSWREILGGRYPKERQMSYNNVIAVHPDKPGCAIWGGMHLYRTDDAGRSWRRITSGERGEKRDYVHNDHHALLWPQEDLIVSGNDGGVPVSRDGGRTWMERSMGMVTAMFYSLDVAPSNGKVFGGGTQDNGVLIAGVGDCKERDFFPAISGDGAWIAFDPAQEGNVFGCITGFEVYRHRKGMPQWRIVFLDRRDQDKARVLDFCAQTADGALARFLEKFPDAVPTIVYRWPSDAEVAGELSAPLPGTTI